MTMPYERKSAVERTHELLVDLLWEKYDECPRGSDLWEEVSRCLKHYPSDFYMDDAAKLAPEVFGEFKQEEQLTEIIVGGIVHTANEGYYYARVVGDDPTTITYTLKEKS